MDASDEGSVARQVQLVLAEERTFELALCAALGSPETLQSHFQDLATWMSNLVKAFADLDVESGSLVSNLKDPFQQALQTGSPDYAQLCGIVQCYESSKPTAPTSLAGSRAVSSLLQPRLPGGTAAIPVRSTSQPPRPPLAIKTSPASPPLPSADCPGSSSSSSSERPRLPGGTGVIPIKPSSQPPRPPLATKPALPLLRAITPDNQVSSPSFVPSLHFSQLSAACSEKQLPKRTSLAPFANLVQQNLGKGVDKSMWQDTCEVTRNADAHPAEAPQNEGRQQKRFGVPGAFKLEDSHLPSFDTHQAPAKAPDERSLDQEQLTVSKPTGPSNWKTPKDQFWDPINKNGGEHVPDWGENLDDPAREMLVKGKKRLRSRRQPKEPPPPLDQRQYYPHPCKGCMTDDLPCFLPIQRRSSRRTCWHCQHSKIKCSYTTNHLLQKKSAQAVAFKKKLEKLCEGTGLYTIQPMQPAGLMEMDYCPKYVLHLNAE